MDKLKPDVSSAKPSSRITLMNFNITKRKKLQFKKLVKYILVLSFFLHDLLEKRKLGESVTVKCFAN